MSSQAARH